MHDNRHTIPVTHCARCGNELTFAEYRQQFSYCTPCQRALEDYAHRQQLGDQLARANQKISYVAPESVRYRPAALNATVMP